MENATSPAAPKSESIPFENMVIEPPPETKASSPLLPPIPPSPKKNSKTFFLLILLFVVLLIGSLGVFLYVKNNSQQNGSLPFLPLIPEDQDKVTPTAQATTSDNTEETLCANAGGTWLSDYYECENISQAKCEEINGSDFNECASACRHSPDAETCIKICVPVCTFD